MLHFVVKRFAYMLLTLWVIITLTFVAMHAIPGNPFNSQKMTPAILANLNAKYGLDRPLHEQYLIYMKNLLHGDLGTSMRYTNRTVNELIERHFPISARLGLLAMAWSVPLGIVIGVIAAFKRDKWQDRTTIITAVVLRAFPGFVFAIFLQLLFGVIWQRWTGGVLLPVAGWGELRHYILPVFCMGIGMVGNFARLMRTSMLDVLQQDYIKTARSKGLSTAEMLWRHGVRNAMLPIVTALSDVFPFILLGGLIIEQIFGIPGLGRHFVQSVGNSDYTMILGQAVFLSSLVVVSFFLADLLYGVVDPRIRMHKGKAA